MRNSIFLGTLLSLILCLTGCVSEKKGNEEISGLNAKILKGFRNDYFVAQMDPVASDNNPGTEERPFKTINGAFKKLKLCPGDTIWVKNGDYRETINLQPEPNKKWPQAAVIASGKNYSKMITLAGYPDQKPVIKGSDEVTDWKKYKDNIWVRNNWPINSQQMFVDGEPLEQIGGKMGPGHLSSSWKWKHKSKKLKDMLAGSFYYDLDEKKLYAWLKDGGDPNKRLMEAGARRFLIMVGELEYIRITDLTLRHGNNYKTESALSIFGRHNVVEDVDQAWHSFRGGVLLGEFITFNRCKFNYNGNSGMGGRRRGHRILDCETSYNNNRDWNTGWGSGGCKFIPNCNDWVLKGHIASYNNADGIWFDESASNVTIEGCRSFRNKACGIHYEISSRGVIKNNIVYENGNRGIYLANSSYCLVANNLCYRNGLSGIVSVSGNRNGGLLGEGKNNIWPGGHNKVVGNILVDNCWNEVRDLKKFPHSWNIRPELIMPHDSETNTGCFSDYNIFYRSGKRDNEKGLKFSRGWAMSFASGLDQWREKTGWDRHSVYAKPIFVNEAEYDFHPKKGCPSLWFVAKPDMAVFYDCEDKLRPGFRAPRTAGPFGGDEKLYAELKKKPQSGAFQMFPLSGGHNLSDLLYFQAVNLCATIPKVLKGKHVTPLDVGIEVDGVPFVIPKKGGITMNSSRPEKSIKPKTCVQKLYFLFTALDTGDKPFAQCMISRADGVKIDLQWRGDGKGGISTVSNKNLTTKEIWSGQVKHWHTEKNKFVMQPFKLFFTTWTNDNEWLAVEKCEFKLLDKKAKFVVIAITGENDPK